MNRESTRHDRLRDNLAATYGSLQRTCDYCETDVNFPPGKVEVEHQCVGLSGNRYRPDLSIWVDGGLIATLEVIDSHSPTSDVLAAEAELPAAFYWTVKGDFWCSSDCYRWSKEGRKRALAIPCCEYCERPFAATAFPEERFFDWESPSGEICAECIVRYLGGSQYKPPGETMDGNTVPTGGEDVRGLILALADAVFWAGVWASRAQEESPINSRRNEATTVTQLAAIERAFDSDEWEMGSRLLSPIGAPDWSADRADPPLFAWAPDNCRRTAVLWERLREWRAAQLPQSLRRLAKLPELPVFRT